MRDPREEIDDLRESIAEGERGGSEADRDVLLEFSDQLDLLSSQYSDHRHLKLLRHCTRMAEHVGGLAESLYDRDAAEEIVRWIHRTYDNEETNRDYRSAIRVFGKRVTRSDETPESIAWVPTGTSNSYDPMPSEADMLRWEGDVLPMIDECANKRDAACIAVQFEAGLRSGELFDLTVGDVFDGEHAMGVHVDGKTGERAVHLIVSVPYLTQWLDDHPADGEDGDAPLWCNLGDPVQQEYNPWLNNFKLPAERAGVDRPVTPTNFRKSNTRWLITSQGLDQTDIEDRQGRERGSKHTARYIARFGEESSERRYAASHGMDVETEESEDVAPVPCPRCGRDTPRERPFCIHCKQALDLEAKGLIDAFREALHDEMIDAETRDEREELVEIDRTVDARPDRLDKEQLHESISSLSSD